MLYMIPMAFVDCVYTLLSLLLLFLYPHCHPSCSTVCFRAFAVYLSMLPHWRLSVRPCVRPCSFFFVGPAIEKPSLGIL
jgi:hypothetical protein